MSHRAAVGGGRAEGDLRADFNVVVAPGSSTARSQSATLVESVDVYRTLGELAGLETPTNLDGVRFANSLRVRRLRASQSPLMFHSAND